MKIRRFCASDFRNIETCDIRFSDGVNMLLGENAQGKTNAVEGIYLFARGKSFRSASDRDMTRFGREGYRLFAEYEDKTGVSTLEYTYYNKALQRKKNGVKLAGAAEMMGHFRAVLFTPDHLELVKAGPEERRGFLNVAIAQVYPEYLRYYARYQKALENRNCLLKFAQSGRFVDERELLAWSGSLASYASYVWMYRRDYAQKLQQYAAPVLREISEGREELTLTYRCDIGEQERERAVAEEEYRRLLSDATERERAAGVTLFGVHRDELEIAVNGKPARLFASQGQQRSIVLSLKMAEGEVSRQIGGEYPVYLFDDVLSELDEGRRHFMTEHIGPGQMILTGCETVTGNSAVHTVAVKGGHFSG